MQNILLLGLLLNEADVDDLSYVKSIFALIRRNLVPNSANDFIVIVILLYLLICIVQICV
jgi:hypothetical protein